MNKPLVSVIIPCYNAELYLEEAVFSITNQTYKNLEILVIDDGCSDNSPKIYKNLSEKDSRIRIIKNELHIGLINTLNKGIDLASGEFIARMDADDISALNRIEKQISFLLKNKSIAVLVTGARVIDVNGKISKDSIIQTYLKSETLEFASYFSQPLVHGSVIAKGSVLKQNKYNLEYKFSEDFELWLRLLAQGYKLSNIPESLYYYRKNPESVSNQNTIQQVKTHNKISKIYLEKKYKIELNDSLVEIINNRPLSPISVNKLKNALTIFKNLYTKHYRNSLELKTYKTRQSIDICIQAIKSNSHKVIKLRLIAILFPYLFSRAGIQFLIEKLKK